MHESISTLTPVRSGSDNEREVRHGHGARQASTALGDLPGSEPKQGFQKCVLYGE